MPNRIDTPEYWIEDFQPTADDMESLYGHALEVMTPFDIETLASVLIRRRVDQIVERRQAKADGNGALYQPSDRYEKGQKLVFSALGGATGTVSGTRPGNNPAYGDYEVVQVKIGRDTLEFATGITFDHQLVQPETDADPEALSEAFAPVVAPGLASVLSADAEWMQYGGVWVLRPLLPEINAGHCNLAEAIIMLAGEPLPAEQILAELDLDPSIPVETRVMALEIALSSDPRFRNVGALESPLWTLAPTT